MKPHEIRKSLRKEMGKESGQRKPAMSKKRQKDELSS